MHLSGTLILQRQIITYNIYFCIFDPEPYEKTDHYYSFSFAMSCL